MIEELVMYSRIVFLLSFTHTEKWMYVHEATVLTERLNISLIFVGY